MDRILLVIVMGIPIIPHLSNAETIEFSTGMPMTLTPPTINSNSPPDGRNQFLRVVENYLTESTNVKTQPSNPSVDYIGQPLYPVYPQYNAVGNMNTSVVPVNGANETTNYSSLIVLVLKMGVEVFRQLFLYYLIRYFVIKLINLFDFILALRALLISDELSDLLTKTTLKAGIQIIGNISYFLIKGAGVLTIGGIITTVICYFTSICTVKYNGLKSQKDTDNGAIRAFMRPDKLASLAALVQEAISKYQTLQKSTA
uniref:Uncharacterized protein n=1 Tax=Dendroctonus ponderosae TaxID=77166 RepID=A0AAR5PZP4_DENPD